MRLANVAGRLVMVTGAAAGGGAPAGGGIGPVIDVADASGGRFGPDPQDALDDWDAFLAWAPAAAATTTAATGAATEARLEDLGPVVPRPRQIFAVGLNYRDHAAEAGLALPDQPMIFTKFQSCLAGPTGDIVLPSGKVDWEVELVVVIGRAARDVAPDRAWHHVAGLTIGQDLSDRGVQMLGTPPQFSLGKSFPGFGPVGPFLTTLDEVGDPGDLVLTTAVNGEVRQRGSTKEMVFDVPALIGYLSGICTLYPGDLIFTGTPAGVGMGHRPPRFLAPGDVLETRIDGLGEMRHRCVAPA